MKIHLLHLVGILFPHIIDDARSKPHQSCGIDCVLKRRAPGPSEALVNTYQTERCLTSEDRNVYIGCTYIKLCHTCRTKEIILCIAARWVLCCVVLR